MNHIYIIEDDSVLCSELALALEAVGYHTTCANDFNNVLNEFLLVSPDLVILDINLPNTDGFILCMKIRKVSQVPIIFITGRDSQIDELQALSLGGDDYITKPYSLPVLMARIKNTLKRTYRSETSSEIEYNGLKLDLSNCTVMYNNVCVELSKRETQILCKPVSAIRRCNTGKRSLSRRCRASGVKALRLRRNAFTLAHSFSVEFKSGLYDGK